jgi:hypothetical protein
MGVAARSATDALLSAKELEYASGGKGEVCPQFDRYVPIGPARSSAPHFSRRKHHATGWSEIEVESSVKPRFILAHPCSPTFP